MSKQELEDAALALMDFWDADESEQQKALDVASKCINAVLRMMEEDG